MQSTLKNLCDLSSLYSGPVDLSKAATEYQKNQDPVILAYVFVTLYPLIRVVSDRYFYLTDSDRASFAVEELDKSMREFRLDGGAQIQTFFCRYFTRRLYAETKMLGHHVRRANRSADSWEEVTEGLHQGTDESGYSEVEFMIAVRSSGRLTVNEVRYCEIILDAGSGEKVVKDSDIAEILGVSSAAVFYLKKSLEKKLKGVFDQSTAVSA